MGRIEVDIVRPVNPTGVSFIKYVYGAVASKNRKVIENFKKEFTKLVTRFGYKLEEEIGTNKLITGKIVLEIDENGKPTKIFSEKIEIWDKIKELNKKIELLA